jgi:DNA-nicking Smr family endonuclease
VLSAQEIELWRSVTEGKTPPRHVPEAKLPPSASLPKTDKFLKKTKPLPAPHMMDNATRNHIYKGKTDIYAVLDLHGFNVEAAYQQLLRFVAMMQGTHSRVVLVITGKGRAPQSGILRTQLPHWLEIPPLRDQVGGFCTAGDSHGGEGAWYIKIRKRGVVGK